jgi:hypothetical protein
MPKGVRLDPKHDERTRAKIQTSQIINQLTKHVKGEVDMTKTQIKAAEMLLNKTLPDAKPIDLSAEEREQNFNDVQIILPDNGRNDPYLQED